MHRRDLIRLLALGGLAAASGCGQRRTASSSDSLADLDCIDQHELVISGELSAVEVVQAALDRIDAVNGILNAVVTRDDDRALARAREVTGQLAGVPYLLKDLNPYAGMRTTYGSALYENHVPDQQTAFTDRIDAAGLVVLGKSNTPEFGLLPSTSPKLHGPARNPWNTEHTPGGSSGGAAAAVAARMVSAAQAGDGGGSIRIPAAQCGLFGLKPSVGRFPDQGHGSQAWPISVKHAITRSVRDSALILALTEHVQGGPLLPVGFVSRNRLRPLKVAVSKSSATSSPSDSVSAAVDSTAALLESMGHEVVQLEESPHDDERFVRHFATLYGSGVFDIVQRVAAETSLDPADTGLLEPATIALAQQFGALPRGALQRALDFFAGYRADVNTFFETYDVWLSPVTATTAPKIGHLDPAVDFDELTQRVQAFAGYTATHNVAGTPAMSVPAGRSEDGLPIGVQFAAAHGAEALLLQLAYHLEEARPWRQALPPVHA